MLLDDGGDLTAIMHSEYKDLLKDVKGVSEETTTGIKALNKMEKDKSLLVPAINVNDSLLNQNLIIFMGVEKFS